MSKVFQLKSFLLVALFLTITFVFCSFTVNAQTTGSGPQFLVSWQANSFVPSWYQGKIFPTSGSRVSVGFDVIDGGKAADLSKNKIRWYVNDNMVISEVNKLGVKNYSFIDNDYSGSDTNIRISIPDYKTGPLDYILTIPVVSPEISINSPYFGKTISTGKSVFEAVPFFFGTTDLNNFNFKWSVNSQNTTESNSQFLNLNIDPSTAKGSIVNINIFVKNTINELEQASKNIQLIIK